VNFRFLPNTLQSITGEGDLGAVLRGAGTTFAIRVVATVIAYVSILALARWMGAAEYGAFVYAFAWVYLLVMPAGLGIPATSVRFLPEYAAGGAWSHVRGLVSRGVWLTILTSAAIALIAILIVLFAGDRVPTAYHAPLIIALAGLPVIALITLGSQIGRALGWVTTAYSPSQIWHPLLVLVTAGILVATGTPVVARLMVAVSIALAAACVLAQGLIYVRRLLPRLRNVTPQHDQRAWLRVSLPLLLIDGFAALINYSDILMVGLFVGPAAVAYYAAASRTAALVTFFYTSICTLSGPRIAELYAHGRKHELQDLFSGIAPWITAPPAAVALVLAVMGSPLLRLFGHGFDAAWLALILLAFANLVASVTGPSALLLSMTGHQDISAKVHGAAAVANLVLNALFIPRFGLTGAAFATAIATSVSNLTLVVVAQRKLGIRTSMFPIGPASDAA
jgi:O-antigen/teichoic acid export membrane protein